MKTTSFIAVLSIAMVRSLEAQVDSSSLDTNTVAIELSLSESNAVVQGKVEALRELKHTYDASSVAMHAQETNQMLTQPVIVTDASSLRTKPATPEEIEFLAGEVIARFGPHRVDFPLNTADSILLRTPGGLRLENRVLGLCYLGDDGESVMLGEVKATEGEFIPPNRVIYRDAFDGGVSADILFEYTSSSFEQWVVIRKRLPSTPKELGFAQPEKVRLAVLTEFINSPEPRKVVENVSLRDYYESLGVSTDESLRDETLISVRCAWFPARVSRWATRT
jgi:hypothetical protein